MSLYEKFTWRGKTLDRMTIAAMLAAEKRLGYEMSIIQGSYNSAVLQSAGTHDGGGAVDLVWVDIKRKNRALRKEGCFAGWPRETLPGEWSRHWHGILIGNHHASDSAKRQVDSYRRGRDGLAGDRPDGWRYRPRPIRDFNYGRQALVSWRRLNAIAKHKGGKAYTPSGAREVEVVARALRGFNMNLGRHRAGRMDEPLLDAIARFRKLRHVGPTDVQGPLTPKVCWEMCVPTKEEK